eukprot:CAMPEP_0113490664 /NCGR_PEP_ID=MMETSP0014_2-20120614/27163_1 /TAXON_ID=2857 /ORGANISM="Nitzschia sp." /LENGTH=759 /DNA_ID=CAMNT_0000384443 /DNA_START=95 /DNA_END=2374 /DNA_ORIENTATION=- /assembly_acc=CAM_ASM_000159
MAPSCSPPSLTKIDSFSSSNSSSTADQQQQQQQQQQQPESWSKLTFPDPASSTSSPPEKRKGSVGVLTQVSVPSVADANVPAGSSSSRKKKSSKKTKKSLPPLSPGSTPIGGKKKKNLVASKTIQAAAFSLVEDGDSDAATERVEKPKRRNSGSSTTSATSAVSSSSASATADVSKLSVISTTSSAVVSDIGSCDDAAPTTSPAASSAGPSLPSAVVATPLKSIVKKTTADSNVETKNGNRITFKESELGHEVEFIESHKEYNSKERGNCWYSAKDKERMMSRHERVVARMEKKKAPKNDDQSYRGLESWTTEGAQHLDEVIALSVNAVMDEQDRQWKVNVDDFDLIAARATEVTNESGRRARIVGMEDQKEAFAVRRLPWLESSSDDASCCSSVVSHSLKSQIAARKRKETAAKKRERIEKGDMGTSSKSSPASSKSKKGKKSSKRKGGDKDKAGPDLDKMLRGLNEISKNEHEQAATQAADPLLTPYLRSSLSLNEQHADRTNPSPSMSDFASTNAKAKEDPDDEANSGLLSALLDRRSAQSGSQSVVSEPSSPSKKSKSKDKKKKKKSSDSASVVSEPSSPSKSRKSKDKKKLSSKSQVPPIPPPPPVERHRTSPQRTMSLSMDPPGRRGSVVIDPKTGQKVGSAGLQLARSKSAMDIKDRMRKEETIHEEETPRIGRSLSSKDVRSQSARDLGLGTMPVAEEVTPPTSPNSVSSAPLKRRLSSPDAVKGMLKAPQRLYDSLRRNSSSKELSPVLN